MKKYKVTQKFMDELAEWQNKWENDEIHLNETFFNKEINTVEKWRFTYFSKAERNQRFGALVNWINGEDVFEIGTPKYVVQRKDAVLSGVHQYLKLEQNGNFKLIYGLENATRFDDFEKASEWANKHFEVVEVDE